MRPRVLFVSDPLCSWCWGTLPEVLSARASFADEVDFDLIMGGLQIGTEAGLAEYNKRQLHDLWQQVSAVTGQYFSGLIPDGFVYHSELACRAVELARVHQGAPPWDFFHDLQAAFYRYGQNPNDPAVAANLLGIPTEDVAAAFRDATYIDAARKNFALASSLSANALPNLLIDVGDGYRLVCGGYVAADYLIADIRARIDATR